MSLSSNNTSTSEELINMIKLLQQMKQTTEQKISNRCLTEEDKQIALTHTQTIKDFFCEKANQFTKEIEEHQWHLQNTNSPQLQENPYNHIRNKDTNPPSFTSLFCNNCLEFMNIDEIERYK